MTIMGMSGFEYTSKTSKNGRCGGTNCTVIVKNTNTGKELFKLSSSSFVRCSDGGGGSHNASKTFFGLDNKYYHIVVTGSRGASIKWGQVQSDGAVLADDRTVVKNLPFYPLYIKETPITVPTLTTQPVVTPMQPIVVPPQPVVAVVAPKTSSAAPILVEPKIKEESWIQKIINWIIKILNR